jgi:hypothetical protein
MLASQRSLYLASLGAVAEKMALEALGSSISMNERLTEDFPLDWSLSFR